jgi:hypothetical protein
MYLKNLYCFTPQKFKKILHCTPDIILLPQCNKADKFTKLHFPHHKKKIISDNFSLKNCAYINRSPDKIQKYFYNYISSINHCNIVIISEPEFIYYISYGVHMKYNIDTIVHPINLELTFQNKNNCDN